MANIKQSIVKNIASSWKHFTGAKRLLLIIIIIEALFIVTGAYIHLHYFLPSAESALKIGEIMTTEMQSMDETQIHLLEPKLMANEEFVQAYHELLKNIGLFLASMFAVYAIANAIVWYCAHKSVNKNTDWKLMIKIALLCLFWCAIFILAIILNSFLSGSSSMIIPVVSSAWTSIIFVLLSILIAYFSGISFALANKKQTLKNTFILGIKKAKKLVIVFAINGIILFNALLIPYWFTWNVSVFAAIILLVTLPTFAFTRVHLITSTWEKT